MNVSYWISRRLRLGGKGSSAGVVIAVAGVALAVMVMEFTLAIVVGFKDQIQAKLAGFDAQISVYGAYDPYTGSRQPYVSATPQLEKVLADALPDTERRLAVRQPGIIKTDNDFEGIMFIGQAPGSNFDFEKSNIIAGTWPDYASDSCRNSIVISEATASALGLGVGDKVYSTFIIDGNVKMRRNTVAALYRSNFGEYDRTVAYASLAGLQSVCGIDSISGSRIDIRGLAPEKISEAGAALQQALVDAVGTGELDEYYPVETIAESGAIYFSWLSLLDTNVAVIFVLMLCVAGFTLVSSLFILILERVSMIGVLRSLGTTKGIVRRIFIDLGLRIVGLGMVIGNILGIGLLLVQKHTGAIPLDPEMYYLASVPVEIRPWAMVALNIGVAAAAWLILILPARLASGIDPAKTASYE